MTTDRTHRTRRTVLRTTGGLLTLAMAGCVGSPAATGGDAAGAATPQADGREDTGDGSGHHGDDHSDGDHHEGNAGEDHHDEAPDDQHGGPHDGTDHHAVATQDESHAHDEEVGEPVEHAEVLMTTGGSGFHFDPHIVRVIGGGTVRWTNESGAHSATAYHPDNDRPGLVPEGTEGWDSGLMTTEGETYERTFETEGVYHYFCVPHEATGMISTVIVGEPDAHGQPALEAPFDSLPGYTPDKIASLNERVNEALGHSHVE